MIITHLLAGLDILLPKLQELGGMQMTKPQTGIKKICLFLRVQSKVSSCADVGTIMKKTNITVKYKNAVLNAIPRQTT